MRHAHMWLLAIVVAAAWGCASDHYTHLVRHPTPGGPAFLGVQFKDAHDPDDPSRPAIEVISTRPGPLRPIPDGTPLLAPGDLILACNGQPLGHDDFRAWIQNQRSGDTLHLRVRHADGSTSARTVRLANRVDWHGPYAAARTHPLPPANLAAVTAEAETTFEGHLAETLAATDREDAFRQTADLLGRLAGENTSPHLLSRVAVAFEHPTRLAELADDIADAFPERKVSYTSLLTAGFTNIDVPYAPDATAAVALPRRPTATELADHAADVVSRIDRERDVAFGQLPRQRVELRAAALAMMARQTGAEDAASDRHYLDNIATMRRSLHLDHEALAHAAALAGPLAQTHWTCQPRMKRGGIPLPLRLKRAIQGDILEARHTAAGWVIVGGGGPNVYDMGDLAAVIDVGGDDTYHYGSPDNPRTQIVIDCAGDDRYLAEQAGFGPAAGVAGISVLVDRQGDDTYQADDLSLGCGLFGVGVLIDHTGDDTYTGRTWSQGAAIYGVGVLADLGGNDTYTARCYAQAIGGPRGCGVLLDQSGDDRFASDKNEPSVYGTKNTAFGMMQGVGFGFRMQDTGGIGLLLDRAGDDIYDAGEFSQGGGYFWGLGILRDQAGDDAYLGNRYAQGFAAHQAIGLLLDDAGNDRYVSRTAAGQGAAWDESLALCLDRAGDDHYQADSLSLGAAAMQAMAFFVDEQGEDTYTPSRPEGSVLGKSGPDFYHFAETETFSFSVFFEQAGIDTYPATRKNNTTHATGEREAERPGHSTFHGIFSDTAINTPQE